VFGAVDDAHAAGAELSRDAIVRDSTANHCRGAVHKECTIIIDACAIARFPGSRFVGPLYGALRELCSRCKRRIAVGAHGAPARAERGMGPPRATSRGVGQSPTLIRFTGSPVHRFAVLSSAVLSSAVHGFAGSPGGRYVVV